MTEIVPETGKKPWYAFSSFFRMIPSLKRASAFIYRYKWRFLVVAAIGLPVIGLTVFALTPAKVEYVTAVAERGNIEQTVEAVGTVISDRDLQLQFPVSGIVAQVYVKEGDTVRAGQRLAALRAGNLAADIASASARVQQAEADLRKLEEGARPEDIAISEAEVQSRKAALETAKTTFTRSQEQLAVLRAEAETSLSGYVATAESTVAREVGTVQSALSIVRSVYSNNDAIDAVIKYGAAEHNTLMASLDAANAQLAAVLRIASPADYQSALALYDQARAAVNQASAVVSSSITLMNNLPETSSFTESARQSYLASLNAERISVQTSLHDVDSAAKTLRDASAGYATQIAAAQTTMDKAQTDIATYEASLRIAEAQLQLKKAPTRQTDIDAARALVRQYRASLARASADYGNTILTSPISGKVTKVHVKVGEYTPVGAAVAMLGDSPYRIEMYVSEIDVPRVQVTQTGSVELDAFNNVHFKLRVSEVAPAATDRDGVPKYRVRLDFVYPHDELKIGMTGDATIITGIREDAVSIPARAVLERDDGTQYVRIQTENGEIEERTVETGLEGAGGRVEVTGVEEGEVVVVLEKK